MLFDDTVGDNIAMGRQGAVGTGDLGRRRSRSGRRLHPCSSDRAWKHGVGTGGGAAFGRTAPARGPRPCPAAQPAHPAARRGDQRARRRKRGGGAACPHPPARRPHHHHRRPPALHRRDADLVVAMADGRAIEQGSHETLMAQDGLYARLVRTQAFTGEPQSPATSPGHAIPRRSSRFRQPAIPMLGPSRQAKIFTSRLTEPVGQASSKRQGRNSEWPTPNTPPKMRARRERPARTKGDDGKDAAERRASRRRRTASRRSAARRPAPSCASAWWSSCSLLIAGGICYWQSQPRTSKPPTTPIPTAEPSPSPPTSPATPSRST